MNSKKLLLAVMLLLVLVGFILGISLYLQQDQSTLGVFIIIGSAIIGAAAFVSGLNDSFDLVGKISSQADSQKHSQQPRKSPDKAERKQIEIQQLVRGKYRVEKIIRESEQSSVYLVSNWRRQYIYKRTDSDHASMETLIQLSKITHPNLSTPYKVWYEDGYICEIIPYVNGLRASELISQSKYPFSGAILRHCILDVARAITELHQHGLVHRDIHPDNILYDIEQIRFVLIDGSIAVRQGEEQIPIGRIGFSNADQLSGDANFQSDLYAFGATLFTLASKEELPSFEARRARNHQITFPYVPDLINVETAIKKLLSVDENEEFESIQEFSTYIESRRIITQKNSYAGVLIIDPNQYILMGWMDIRHVDYNELKSISEAETALPHGVSQFFGEFYEHMKNEFFTPHE